MKISALFRTRPGFCRAVQAALAVASSLALACSDDDPAQQTGMGGGTASVPPDASVRDLPGDGREATPDFDTESRQRTPIGPQQLVENVDEVRNDIYGEDDGASDAGPGGADPTDGGAN